MKTGFHPQCVEQASNQPLISFLLEEYNNYFCLSVWWETEAETIRGSPRSEREFVEFSFKNPYSIQKRYGGKRQEFREKRRWRRLNGYVYLWVAGHRARHPKLNLGDCFYQ